MGGVPSTKNTSTLPSYSPSSNATTYNDRVQVASDEYAIERVLLAPSTPSSDISSLQGEYNADLAKYKKDLEADLAGLTPVKGALESDPYTPLEQQNRTYDNNELDSIDGKSTGFNYHMLTFTDQNAGNSSLAGSVGGSSFNGAVDPVVFAGNSSVQKGYVAPPAISSGSNIQDVYNNLTPSQAAYLGWAIEQTQSGKQVVIPDGDVKSWDLLSEYELKNKSLSSSVNPDEDSEGDSSGPFGVADEVDSSFYSNTPSDPGKTVLAAITGVLTLGVPADLKAVIPGQAGDVLSGLAGIAAAAIAGVGVGTGVGISALSAGTLSIGGAAVDVANLANSIKNVITAGGLSEAGTALVEELGEATGDFFTGTVPDSFMLNDNVNKDQADGQ